MTPARVQPRTDQGQAIDELRLFRRGEHGKFPPPADPRQRERASGIDRAERLEPVGEVGQ